VNKTEMAKKLASKTGLTQGVAADVVDAIFSTAAGEGIIAVELDAGRKVSISGFGTFETRHRGARMGRNPATGEAIHIAAKNVAAFKAAKGLKDRVAE
jgi:DNA-binding protein HU-beta